jgi:hypothetical protein
MLNCWSSVAEAAVVVKNMELVAVLEEFHLLQE